MVVAIVFLLLVVVSIAFHFLSPWWFTPLASNWGTIDDTIIITFWVTGTVFIAVNVFMAYAIVRYRNRGEKTQRAHYEPENSKLEWWLTIGTSIGIAAMLAPGLYVWNDFVHVPEEAWELEAIGEQWRWTFRLPGDDGKMGTSDSRLVNINNPFGVNPEDINGQDDLLVTSNVVHIPIDQPVKILLRSKDVLHDFAVAQFRVKMDLVPGLVSYLWLTPTKIGSYEILCEELCGLAHFTMRGRVVVDTQEDFDQWKSEQLTFAESMEIGPGDAVAGEPLYGICATCHGVNGEGNLALNSPKIQGQAGWYLERQIQNFKSGARGAHKDDEYGMQMAAMSGVLVDEAAIRNVTAFINTLEPSAAKGTSQHSGDAERGKKLYLTCGTCHGRNGQGNYATNSPRLNGQDGWYMKRQLFNFREGIRGTHANDLFGPQMRSMSKMLRKEKDIDDVVAYITTLRPQQPLQGVAKAEPVENEHKPQQGGD
jgi:cytochrome c oxidase subunit 2